MEFFDLISSRRSVRSFEGKPIPEESIRRILDAASSAASAGNLQSYKIMVVINKEAKLHLSEAAHMQEFIGEASAVFVFCADLKISAAEYGSRGADLYSIQDATIACTYAQLAAHAIGLGTVWVGSFDDAKVKQILKLGSNLRPVAMLVVGHSTEKPDATPRRSIDKLSQFV